MPTPRATSSSPSCAASWASFWSYLRHACFMRAPFDIDLSHRVVNGRPITRRGNRLLVGPCRFKPSPLRSQNFANGVLRGLAECGTVSQVGDVCDVTFVFLAVE